MSANRPPPSALPAILPAVALACALALAGCSGATRAYVVTVFLDTDTAQDHAYAITVLQGGSVVGSKEAEAMGGFPFHNVVLSPSVQEGDAVVEVKEGGVLLASKTVQPHSCPSGEVAVTFLAKDTGVTVSSKCT